VVSAALGEPAAGRQAPPRRVDRVRVSGYFETALNPASPPHSSHYFKRDHREVLFQSHIPSPTGRTLRFAGPLISTITEVFNETIGLIFHRLSTHSITWKRFSWSGLYVRSRDCSIAYPLCPN
jgi:hypothetical protein